MERNPWLRALLIVLFIIAVLHLAGLLWEIGVYLGDILLLFFLAWLLAFVLNPAAQVLIERARFPRVAAAVAVYLALLVIMTTAGLLALPPAATQLARLGGTITYYTADTSAHLSDLQQVLDSHGVPLDLASIYQPQALTQRAEALGTTLAQNALGVAQSVGTVLFDAIIVLVLSFYIMIDGGRLEESLLRWLPSRYRPEVEFFLASVGRTFGGFMRGILVQAVLYGLGTALVMWIAGLNFVLVVSAFAGGMMIIPLFGPLLSIIPPVIIALFAGSLTKTIIVTVALLVLQQIIINVVAPKVMSEALGVHPLLIFFGLLVGAHVAGIWGAIFGVPVAGVAYAMLRFLRERVSEGKYSTASENLAEPPPVA